ncbi:MAG TPA: hypothetical protein DCY13_13995, partial [Verrucomicrobiales bacterium]|nr:hypothetical protein [Verrucomicrobiales bacterium]
FSSSRVALNNGGTIEVVEGTLRLEGGGTIGGVVDIAGGGTLLLQSGTYTWQHELRLDGAGSVVLQGAEVTQPAGVVVVTALMRLNSGTLS